MVVGPHDGQRLTLGDGTKLLVEATDDGRVDMHTITPGGTLIATLEPEESAQLAVALLRERALQVNGHG